MTSATLIYSPPHRNEIPPKKEVNSVPPKLLRALNSVSILFSWYKNFGGVIKVKKGKKNICYRSFHPFTLFKVRADESNMRARIL